VDTLDENTLKESLLKYQELLDQHIKKEDEILYPWMEKNLTKNELIELGIKFSEVNDASGIDTDRYEQFLSELEHN